MLVITLGLRAQGNGFDMQGLFGQDISGTTRYMGMAGAMAAVGGDVSAASDNPAALGIYRRSEILISMDYQLTQSLSPLSMEKNSVLGHNVRFPDVAWVLHLSNQNGSTHNGIMLRYRRAKTFNSEFSTIGRSLDASQTDLMAWQANGLKTSNLDGVQAYDDSEIGWLSKAGYDAWMIDPDSEDDTQWHSCEGGLADNELTVQESGSLDYLTLGWGLGTKNTFYIGLSVNILSLQHSKRSVYRELFDSQNYYVLDSKCSNSGVGINAQLGVMVRPNDYWRLAAAIESPAAMTIKTTSGGNINSRIYTDETLHTYTSYSSSSPYYTDDIRRTTPMRVVAGTAVQLDAKGLLSVEYDYQHGFEAYMVDEHLLKAGLEVVPKQYLFINMGYACNMYGPHKAGEEAFLPNLNSARLDTDFRHYQPRHYASAGISLRTAHFVLGGAYQFAYQKQNLYAHYDQLMGADDKPCVRPGLDSHICAMTHRLVFTMAFRY